MNKGIIILGVFLTLFSIVAAQSLEIEFPNGKTFGAGDPITFKVTLYDDNGNPIDGQILVSIEDAEKKAIKQETVESKEVVSVNLGETASSGQGIITTEYQDIKRIEFFEIGRVETASFELEGTSLKVTNIGNTRYNKVIKITIGETEGTKQPDLDIGESIIYRLVAPEGSYNIRVTDGLTSLIRGGIPLSGTGQVVGAIDESASGRTPLTGVASPDENSDEAILSYIKRNTFIYVFIVAIFAAMILLGIERRYKNKSSKKWF